MGSREGLMGKTNETDGIDRARRRGWTGPRASDLAADGVTLLASVPPERWPYGPPDFHESSCGLHRGGRYCDCEASAADDVEWGWGA